jgi:hypothetical protein
MVEASDALIDGGPSASRQPKEDGGLTGWDTCHLVIGPV